jgi:hypothetical protein
MECVIRPGGKRSLALERDIHILANAGGRERTKPGDYHALLERPGFVLRDLRPLPLDIDLLVAAPMS